MKNLTKRSKILFAILGVVVVVVVIGLVLGLTDVIDLPLQGGPFTAYLSPETVSLPMGQTQTLTLYKYGMNTSWKIMESGCPVPGVVEVSHDRTHITVKQVVTACDSTILVYGTAGTRLDFSQIYAQR